MIATLKTLYRRFDTEVLDAFVPWHQRTWRRHRTR